MVIKVHARQSRVKILAEARDYLLKISRPVLGLTKPPIQGVLDWFWVQTSLIYNGYQGLFPRGSSGQSVWLTVYLPLVPQLHKTI
jgi:hypothetical protein